MGSISEILPSNMEECVIVYADVRRGYTGKTFNRIVRTSEKGHRHVFHHEPGTPLRSLELRAAVRRAQKPAR